MRLTRKYEHYQSSVTQQNLMYFLIYDNFALHPNYMVQYLKKCVGFLYNTSKMYMAQQIW